MTFTEIIHMIGVAVLAYAMMHLGAWVERSKHKRVALFNPRMISIDKLPKDCGIIWVPTFPAIGEKLADSFYEVK